MNTIPWERLRVSGQARRASLTHPDYPHQSGIGIKNYMHIDIGSGPSQTLNHLKHDVYVANIYSALLSVGHSAAKVPASRHE